MKKIFRGITIFFYRLFKIIDRKIIFPISKVLVSLKESIDSDSKRFEKFLTRKNSLIFISLVIALIVFMVIDSKSVAMLETSAEVLYNQKVDAQYNTEAYVIEGIPATVDITLIGRKSDLYLARQIPDHEVTLDLSGLKPGTHRVNLKYKRVLASINYKLDPSVVTVTIHPKISEVRTINVDLLNLDNLDSKLIVQNVETERNDIIIKGSEKVLKRVATVKALIDVNNFVKPEEGTMEVQDIPLIAYDEIGNVVDIEIVPSRITANITIASPRKVVPIRVIPVGDITFGKAISNIDLDVKEVTIYGDENVLAGINNVSVEIDVNGLKEDKKYTATLKNPAGIRHISSNVVNVDIKVEDETTMEFEGINIEYKNLDESYTVNAKTERDRNVTVIVKGVKSVLDNIDPNNIRVYVDLKGYGSGEHEVDVYVERTDLRVIYLPKVKKVTLVISVKR